MSEVKSKGMKDSLIMAPFNMSSKRSSLHILLALLAVILAVLLFRRSYPYGKVKAGASRVGSVVKHREKAGMQGESGDKRSREFYDVVVSRNLFSPERKKSSGMQMAKHMGVDELSEDKFILEGVMIIGKNKRAFIRKTGVRGDREVLKLKVGDIVGRYSVSSITKDNVVLKNAVGTEKVITLFSLDSYAKRSHEKTSKGANLKSASRGAAFGLAASRQRGRPVKSSQRVLH